MTTKPVNTPLIAYVACFVDTLDGGSVAIYKTTVQADSLESLAKEIDHCKRHDWDGFGGDEPAGTLDGSTLVLRGCLALGVGLMYRMTVTHPDVPKQTEATAKEIATLIKLINQLCDAE